MSNLRNAAIEAMAEALRGDAAPLARFGVTMTTPIPWWRRRVQRYLAPGRFLRWVQVQILHELGEGNV